MVLLYGKEFFNGIKLFYGMEMYSGMKFFN